MTNKSDLLKQLKIDKDQPIARPDIKKVWLVSAIGGSLLLIILIWAMLGGERVFSVATSMARIESVGDNGGQIALQATGYVTARLQATVSSKVMGKVDKLLVEEGDHVEADQILATLDDSNTRQDYLLTESQLLGAKAQVNETRALLQESELAVKRKRELFARQLISRSELDNAEASYHSLQARLQSRQAEVQMAENQIQVQKQRLEDLVIRAPFAGVVVAKNAQPGEMISPLSSGGYTRTGICSIVDMSSLEIEVDVNEAYIDRVQPGQAVQAALDAYPDWRIPAKVAAIIPTADRQKATVKVRIAFDELDPRILPDMGIKVAFMEYRESNAAEHRGLLLVPRTAVREENGQSILFVVEAQRAVQRMVEQHNSSNNDKVIITSGLKPGETYINDIPEGLSDGDAIETR
ncbi:MAG: efflux RND transporter periplasmic adaptor subunit [Gammaproteobacteria bacterium]|nr:efflux RND transporter periplasmic adaptor subunit [Gammaproteobacteria bacterium]